MNLLIFRNLHEGVGRTFGGLCRTIQRLLQHSMAPPALTRANLLLCFLLQVSISTAHPSHGNYWPSPAASSSNYMPSFNGPYQRPLPQPPLQQHHHQQQQQQPPNMYQPGSSSSASSSSDWQSIPSPRGPSLFFVVVKYLFLLLKF